MKGSAVFRNNAEYNETTHFPDHCAETLSPHHSISAEYLACSFEFQSGCTIVIPQTNLLLTLSYELRKF